jgi:hypothetical protein
MMCMTSLTFGALAALVDDGQVGPQALGVGARALHTTRIRGHVDRRFA